MREMGRCERWDQTEKRRAVKEKYEGHVKTYGIHQFFISLYARILVTGTLEQELARMVSECMNVEDGPRPCSSKGPEFNFEL